MKRIAAFCCVIAFAIAAAVDVATVQDVATNPARFDKRQLTLVGKVAKFTAKISRAGKPYFTFDLVDGKAKIAVYGQNVLEPTPNNGDRVEAAGIFAVSRESAGVIFYNELDVTSNGIDRNGVKPLK